ncbi:MAG: extracellular solute-binding protein [Patescibacteria group bacterium]
MKTFPTIVLGIFLTLALIGMVTFATFSATNSQDVGAVTIWGSVPVNLVEELLTNVRGRRDDFNKVKYIEVRADTLDAQLVEAIAAGQGPDLVVFPASSLVKDSDKLMPIPFDSYPRRDFLDTFIDGASVYISDEGVLGIPFVIDPMVMYYNKALFADGAVARSPRTWDEVIAVVPSLTKKTSSGTVTQAAVALGEWDNVRYAKDILVTMMTQLGTPVIGVSDVVSGATRSLGYRSLLLQTIDGISPADSAVRLYTGFSDPAKPAYSWNRSQKESRTAFVAGELAIYLGYASELTELREINPNLNYDVAPIPMMRGGGSQGHARILALSVPRGSHNPNGAILAAYELSGATAQAELVSLTHMPSPRRDIDPSSTENSYAPVFRAAALKSFAFLDPDPASTDPLFGRMVENIASGKYRVSESLRALDEELTRVLKMK